ncbi:MAG: hypothetical protein GY724_10275, partial [Actinomycetia bacterium]|nr:hypothetical protein [Actinomycetes bacterium]
MVVGDPAFGVVDEEPLPTEPLVAEPASVAPAVVGPGVDDDPAPVSPAEPPSDDEPSDDEVVVDVALEFEGRSEPAGSSSVVQPLPNTRQAQVPRVSQGRHEAMGLSVPRAVRGSTPPQAYMMAVIAAVLPFEASTPVISVLGHNIRSVYAVASLAVLIGVPGVLRARRAEPESARHRHRRFEWLGMALIGLLALSWLTANGYGLQAGMSWRRLAT